MSNDVFAYAVPIAFIVIFMVVLAFSKRKGAAQ